MSNRTTHAATPHPATGLWTVARGLAKLVAIVAGLPLALVGLAALVGLYVPSIWGALGLAAVLVVGVPLFLVDRLVPSVDLHDAAALARVRGLPTDILALVWMTTAFLVFGPLIGATRAPLHQTAARLDEAGQGGAADATRWLAGTDPHREEAP